jgi:hypothetical protein
MTPLPLKCVSAISALVPPISLKVPSSKISTTHSIALSPIFGNSESVRISVYPTTWEKFGPPNASPAYHTHLVLLGNKVSHSFFRTAVILKWLTVILATSASEAHSNLFVSLSKQYLISQAAKFALSK